MDFNGVAVLWQQSHGVYGKGTKNGRRPELIARASTLVAMASRASFAAVEEQGFRRRTEVFCKPLVSLPVGDVWRCPATALPFFNLFFPEPGPAVRDLELESLSGLVQT